MLHFIILLIALLLNPATTAFAETQDCRQLSDFSAARLRWAAARKSSLHPSHNVENCRSYGSNFFEAVAARQAASMCRESIERRRIIELLDSEIGALNDVIAAQCSG